MRPTIALCMIVKNEESQLPRCLASVQGVVDDMIVVDTGSTDRTVAIATEYGARVVEHPWDGSFSSARNVSLDQATADWVLILDADECLADGSALLRGVATAPAEFEAFILPLVNFVGERANEEAVTAPGVRLFRNRPEYRYSRALHEQIMLSIQAARPDAGVGYLDAPIEHYGYLNGLVTDKDKIRRNLALASEEVRRYPRDAFSWYNLGQEHFRLGEWDQAINAYQTGFPYLQSLAAGFAPALIKHLCVCLLNCNRNAEAVEVIDDAVQVYEAFTDLYVLRGLARLQDGDPEAALAEFRLALAKGEVGGGFFISDEGVGSYKALWWIGACELQLGHLAAAEAAYAASLHDLAARHRYLTMPLSGLLQVWGLQKLDEATQLRRLGQVLELSDPRWRQLAARLLLEQNRLTAAEELLQETTTWEPATLLALGVAQLRHGHAAAALQAWDAVPATALERLTADWHRLLALGVTGDVAGAAELLETRLAAHGESELVTLYRAVVRLWQGAPEPARPPVFERGTERLRAHLCGVLELLLAAEAYEVFEQTCPALGWLGCSPAQQAGVLGRLYYAAGLSEPAFETLVLAIEGGETDSEHLRLLGLLCLRRGQYAEAEGLLGEVLRRQRAAGLPLGRQNTTLLGFLSALSAQGKNDEAEPLWQQLLADEPASPACSASIA
ncbi:MAG: glycosyltransferase [Fimbriimonadaceae bacterium]|nr:glycosyltransferase [Fimbriimonadaceae bacterium]